MPIAAPSTEVVISIGEAAQEVRCPNPHPARAGQPCGRLLLRYNVPASAEVEVWCPRCKGHALVLIASTQER